MVRSFVIKCPLASALPQRQRGTAIIATGATGKVQERAIERGAIIIGKFDKTRFLNEPAQFDQMPCSFASLHRPLPRIKSPLSGFSAEPRRRVAHQRLLRRYQQRHDLRAHVCRETWRHRRASAPSPR